MSDNRSENESRQDGSNTGQQQHSASQWAEVIGQLVDKLTGKGATVTYAFDNLEIDMPKAQGPNGQNVASATWKLNGKLIIAAEAHRKDGKNDVS